MVNFQDCVSCDMSKITLSPEDLSDLIGLTYDSAFEQVQWTSLLRRLCEMFPGIHALAWAYDGDTLLPEYANPGTESFFTEKIEFDFKNESKHGSLSVAEAMKHTPNGFVARSKRIVNEEVWLETRVYRDFFKPAGFRNCLQMKVDHSGDRGAALGFAIPEDPMLEAKLHDPLFEVLKLLAPHAVRASQLARAMTMAKRATQVFSGFLDGIILPMLVTDATGKYLFGNAAGRRMLDRGDPFVQAADARLRLEESHDTADLYHKLRETDRDLVQNGMRVLTSDTPLMIAITPFRASMREASAIDRHLLSEERLFAIFVGQSTEDAVNTNLLEDVFDLTGREAEVCKFLLLGHSVAEIAALSDRSPKTVRNQIQVIYEKVGVSSNTGLMDALSVFRTVGTVFEAENNLGTAPTPRQFSAS